MSVLTGLCLIAFGFGIGVAIGAAIQKSADKKDCNACWSEMYDGAWALEINGREIKMLPVKEYTERGIK